MPEHLLVVQISQTCLFKTEVDFAVLSRVCLLRGEMAMTTCSRFTISPLIGLSDSHTGEEDKQAEMQTKRQNQIISPAFLIEFILLPSKHINMQASKQTYSLLNLNVYFGSFLVNFIVQTLALIRTHISSLLLCI